MCMAVLLIPIAETIKELDNFILKKEDLSDLNSFDTSITIEYLGCLHFYGLFLPERIHSISSSILSLFPVKAKR